MTAPLGTGLNSTNGPSTSTGNTCNPVIPAPPREDYSDDDSNGMEAYDEGKSKLKNSNLDIIY